MAIKKNISRFLRVDPSLEVLALSPKENGTTGLKRIPNQ